MNRTERLAGIVLALRTDRRTAQQLADRFEVSRRTILRDIDGLSQVGVPILALPGPGGGYELPDDYWMPPLHLTPAEAHVLLLGLQALGSAEGSPLGPAHQSVVEKLRAALRPDVREAAQVQLEELGSLAPLRRPTAGHVDVLRDAAGRRAWVRVTYRSLRRTADQLLLPLRLWVSEGRWYCAAVSLEAGTERSYRVERMLSVEAVAPPPGAAAAIAAAGEPRRPYGDAANPEVVARLTDPGTRQAEDHPDLAPHIEEVEGGSWQLRFHCPADELPYYARELYRLGREVTVLGPAELVTLVRAMARETWEHHGGAGNGDRGSSPSGP